MNAFHLAKLLRNLATPFILIAIWGEFRPAQLPGWIVNGCLLINSGLLLSSIILKVQGPRR